MGDDYLQPGAVAKWLIKQYIFIAEFKTKTPKLYVYSSDDGTFSEQGADAIIAKETQIIYGNELTTQKLNNVKVNVLALTANTKIQLFPAVRELDDGSIAINLLNGVLVLNRSSELFLKEHSPQYGFSSVIPIKYDESAKCFGILDFLSSVAGDDLVLFLSILESFAFTLTPGYKIHKSILFLGEHNAGKSTTLNLLRAFLGENNVQNMTLQRLTYNRFALDWLSNKLANISPDLPTRAIDDGGVFKAATGEDVQMIERKGDQTPYELKNAAKMLFSANALPPSADNTTAYYDRWLILEFKQHFDGVIDPLPSITKPEELSGLLNILVQYFVPTLLKNRKFLATTDSTYTRDLYLKNADNVRAFAENCLSYDVEADIPKSDFYEAYSKFCEMYNLIPDSEVAFWRKLKQIVTYTEHRPERGGPAWIRGQRLSPVDQTQETKKVDPLIRLLDPKYELYIKFLEKIAKELESVKQDDCTRCTRITNISLLSAKLNGW
ncbi:MAG: DNA primase family protein, partial [Hydrogenobaculum sp.]